MRFKIILIPLLVAVLFVLRGPAAQAAGWVLLRDPGNATIIYDIRAPSLTNAYAVGSGGTMLRTTDGSTWSGIAPKGYATTTFYGVDAVSNTVFVVGVNVILRSTDSGAAWVNVSPAGLTLGGQANLRSVDFVDANRGWIVGDQAGGAVVLRTINGGASWTSQQGNLPGGITRLNDISCSSASTCIAVGDNGRIVRTTNAGSSWPLQTSGTTSTLEAVKMLNSSIGWVAGRPGVVLETSNGGGSWQVRTFSGSFLELDLLNSTGGVVVGASGVTWQRTASGWTGLLSTGTDMYAVDLVVLSSGFGGGAQGRLYRFDDVDPSVGVISPTSARAGVATTFSASYSDDVGVAICQFVEPSDVVGGDPIVYENMALSVPNGMSGTATISYTFAEAGTHRVRAECEDRAGNRTDANLVTVTVTTNNVPAAPADLSQYDDSDFPAIAVGASVISPVDFSGVASDTDGDTVRLELEIRPIGAAFTNSSTHQAAVYVASGSISFARVEGLAAGSYHWQARAVDSLGAASTWVSYGGNAENVADFVVSSGEDTTPPAAPSNLRILSAATDTTPSFAWDAATDNSGIDFYRYSIAFSNGARDSLPSGDISSLIFTVSDGSALAPANYYIEVWAYDTAGNIGPRSQLFFTVEEASVDGGGEPVDGGTVDGGVAPSTGSAVPGAGEPSTPSGLLPSGLNIGDLVKLADDGNPNTFGDSAVFYLGADGGRYVFPNDKAYFSWYTDFSAVKLISSADMASIPLRGNVTYRPGVSMVKLQTSPTVYVVTAGGVLRAVPDEATARSLYGNNWNQRIDDINDAFWTNYRVGMSLGAAGDFNPTAVREAAININSDRGLL